MIKEQIPLEMHECMPFDAVFKWAYIFSTDWYDLVPYYRDKKRQKEYEKWQKVSVHFPKNSVHSL